MLTPQEVSERAFTRATFGGYNMAMVDEFLDLLTTDYTALYQENAMLKGKLKVLSDTIKEYKATEGAMRQAFVAAQRVADDMAREAEQKKAQILQDAEREAAERIAQLSQDIQAEEFRLTAAQRATAEYVAKVQQLHAQELEYLSHLDEITPTPEPADQINQAAQEIDDNVRRLLAAAQAEAQAELARESVEDRDPAEDTTEFAVDSRPAAVDAAPEEDGEDDGDSDLSATTVHHIDFGDLQFGKDYEIK